MDRALFGNWVVPPCVDVMKRRAESVTDKVLGEGEIDDGARERMCSDWRQLKMCVCMLTTE